MASLTVEWCGMMVIRVHGVFTGVDGAHRIALYPPSGYSCQLAAKDALFFCSSCDRR